MAEAAGTIAFAWVAVAADGGFLITDSGNLEMRKVATSQESAIGVITRVAGTPISANLGNPVMLASDRINR